jgi:hypothetical protein
MEEMETVGVCLVEKLLPAKPQFTILYAYYSVFSQACKFGIRL